MNNNVFAAVPHQVYKYYGGEGDIRDEADFQPITAQYCMMTGKCLCWGLMNMASNEIRKKA